MFALVLVEKCTAQRAVIEYRKPSQTISFFFCVATSHSEDGNCETGYSVRIANKIPGNATIDPCRPADFQNANIQLTLNKNTANP